MQGDLALTLVLLLRQDPCTVCPYCTSRLRGCGSLTAQSRDRSKNEWINQLIDQQCGMGMGMGGKLGRSRPRVRVQQRGQAGFSGLAPELP